MSWSGKVYCKCLPSACLYSLINTHIMSAGCRHKQSAVNRDVQRHWIPIMGCPVSHIQFRHKNIGTDSLPFLSWCSCRGLCTLNSSLNPERYRAVKPNQAVVRVLQLYAAYKGLYQCIMLCTICLIVWVHMCDIILWVYYYST